MRKPSECQNKEQIRAEIDRLDRQLVGLLTERFEYVRRMAEIKQDPGEAHVQQRVDEVIEKVVAEAEATGLDPGLVREIWERLIAWNVDYERQTIAARKG
jgi:isochorismate pyruvate lyase